MCGCGQNPEKMDRETRRGQAYSNCSGLGQPGNYQNQVTECEPASQSLRWRRMLCFSWGGGGHLQQTWSAQHSLIDLILAVSLISPAECSDSHLESQYLRGQSGSQ